MLPVTVNGHGAQRMGAVGQNEFKSGFQRPPFAAVDFMGQYGDGGVGFRLLKPVQPVRIAAVVDNHDVGKSGLHQAVHHTGEFFVRVQGGQYNGEIG